MDKLKMHSPDLADQNINKIADLFPHCITEAKDEDGNIRKAIDFDLLRQELSREIVEGPQERYQLNWPGKREALLTANAPISKTLRPCREESVDFDTTENLFIEGDNLDALKLLQETYLGAIKMAYLDPPYNRKKGENLVYRDSFVGSTYDYLVDTNQVDDEDKKLVSNSDSNGRFHSDWLTMIYLRIKLTKNILSDDGIIAISIDDSETSNIRQLCDWVFGESNFVGTIIWKNVTDNNPTNIAIEHESIHVYAKSKSKLEKSWKSKISSIKDVLINIGNELNCKYSEQHDLQKAYTKWFKVNKSELGPLDRYKYIDEGGIYTGSQSVHNPGKEGYRYNILHPVTGENCKQPLMGYRFPESTMIKLLEDDKVLFGDDHNKTIELKVYAKDFTDKLSSVFHLDGRTGPYDLKQLFPETKKAFSNPKPVKLMERLLTFMVGRNEICIDLFAGSASTAHALMGLNIDGGRRKFIELQYPEEITGKTKDSKLSLKLCKDLNLPPKISEISKERIRRSAKKILDENKNTEGIEELDTGFRVLKIDSSNMTDVYYNPDQIIQGGLFDNIDNVKSDRTEEDLLFQVMLDWGVDLTLPINRESIDNKTVFFVDNNSLVACFDNNGGVTEDFVKELAQHEPLRVVFRDGGFASDSTKINVEQIFKQLSPMTDVKSI
ncbi:site-specific DNA-methyltransferase [Leucothrix pacifica]|uniref:site-specific DNA-methyltransferase (adenine-specific) n=1 Tax=Leucothrix pacifica TaxID=1247513 RepID=A0A317CNH7_9GAMM|nr:site-specific DNA-methyltransferase [Leucothrix pacifica]PWQ97870.1 site-specific DNA-methyltransferase [Leucothrix pacifica]